MKEIRLTQGRVTFVDDDDYEYLNQFKWHYTNGAAGRDIGTGKRKKRLKMHRIINNTPDGFDTDHINRNQLDNRRSNLRTATHSQNGHNRPVQKNNKIGVKGVSWSKQNKKWYAQLHVRGKYVFRGHYDTIESAKRAYDNALEAYVGEYAYH